MLAQQVVGGCMIIQFSSWSFPPQNIGDWLTLGQLTSLVVIAVVLIKGILDNR